MNTFLATAPVIEAVDNIIDACHVEPDERLAVAEAIDEFVEAMVIQVEEIGEPATSWPPLSTMMALEVEVLDEPDDELAVDRAAAVKLVRDTLVARRAWRASQN